MYEEESVQFQGIQIVNIYLALNLVIIIYATISSPEEKPNTPPTHWPSYFALTVMKEG